MYLYVVLLGKEAYYGTQSLISSLISINQITEKNYISTGRYLIGTDCRHIGRQLRHEGTLRKDNAHSGHKTISTTNAWKRPNMEISISVQPGFALHEN